MNTHVPINGSSTTGPPTSRLDSDIYRHLGTPNGAERVREEALMRFRRDNPRIEVVSRGRKTIELNLTHREEELKRHFKAKADTDLTRPRLGELHQGSTGRFEQYQFSFYCAAALIGVTVGWYSLANYVASSGVIPALDGNVLGSLLVSAAPLTGSVAFKAVGDLLATDKHKRRYFLGLAGIGGSALLAHLLAMSATFGPTRVDVSAIGDQLMTGGTSVHQSGGIADIAPILVLGSGLLAETLLAPVFMWAATKLSQPRRKLVVPIHEAQIAHDAAIDAINEQIRQLNRQHAALVTEEADLGLRQDAEVAKTLEEFNLLDAEFKREWLRTITKFRAKMEVTTR